MELCVENEEKKEVIESDLDEAKAILQKALCEGCKDNLRMNKGGSRKDSTK